MKAKTPEGEICRAHKCSACCQDVRIRLTKDEHSFLVNAGTDLRKTFGAGTLWNPVHTREYPDGKTTYDMEGKCGLLGENGLCTVYFDPRRPEICATTHPKDEGCASARRALGLKVLLGG